jgi:hypothetical protein
MKKKIFESNASFLNDNNHTSAMNILHGKIFGLFIVLIKSLSSVRK